MMGHVVFRGGRTAINAAKIAAVRHRNAQVGDLPAEFVNETHSCTRLSQAKDWFLRPQSSQIKMPNSRHGIGPLCRARDAHSSSRSPFQTQPLLLSGDVGGTIAATVSGRLGRFHPNPQPVEAGIAFAPSVFSPLGREDRRNPSYSIPQGRDAQHGLPKSLEVMEDGKESSFDPAKKRTRSSTLRAGFSMAEWRKGRPSVDVVKYQTRLVGKKQLHRHEANLALTGNVQLPPLDLRMLSGKREHSA